MLCKLLSVRFFGQIRLSKKNPVATTMEKCYFRHELGDSQFHISFVYSNPEARIHRQFNFSRRTTETVGSLLQRICTNVSKVVVKKNKKKRAMDGQRDEMSELLIEFSEDGRVIEKDTICESLLTKNSMILKVADQQFQVEINAPWVISIALPSSVLSGFPVYPINFKTQFANKDHCSYTWYSAQIINDKGSKILDEHVKWEEVGRGYTYIPPLHTIGRKLKIECVPGSEHKMGPPVDAVSPSCVEAGPGRCPFENRHAFTANKLSGKSFRVVSYNILADLYCDSDFTRTVLHPYCPPYALHIDYRKQLILKELLGYNADIACLQEVDSKIYNHELVPVLGANSYEGVFMKKGKEVTEGLACFFRNDRFSLLNQHNIIFSEELPKAEYFKSIWDTIKDNKPLVDRVLDRSTAGLITVLTCLDNADEILVVGNTHLYFHPDADHIRLIQGGMMIYWMRDVIRTIRTENPKNRVSALLCGDFNSVPSCGIYKLYTTGVAPSVLDDWKSNESEAVTQLSLSQDLILGSACGTPEYTNFTVGFADCLDYIYYEKKSIEIEQVIPFPSIEELKEHSALPSVVFPSDHVALIADLAFIK